MFAVYSSCSISNCFIKRQWLLDMIVIADVKAFEDGSGADSEAIKGMLSDLYFQLEKEEEGYLAEQKIQEQVLEYLLPFVNFATPNTLY